MLFEVFFEFLDGGMHAFIDGGNIGTELSHFLFGLYEIRLQGIEANYQVLATGMGKLKRGGRGKKICRKMIWMNVIRVKR